MNKLSPVVLLLASTALLSACDDKKQAQQANPAGQAKIYKDLDSCLAEAKDMDQVQACRSGYAQALANMENAPRYEQQASCEAVYGPGNCVPRGTYVHDGGGWFVPYMMGYMMGGGFGGRSTIYQPVFIDRSGSTYAGSSIVSSPTWSGNAQSRVATAPSSIARGGFGSSATASSTAGG
jgi:uncharacterized protein YgiB involved in biofilm formation